MTVPKCALLFAIILTLLLDPISGKHGFGGGHSYPKSGGLSGGGHQSGGLSGGSHGYPSSGSNHGYPSSSNSHGYPPSTGLSGGGSRYPASNPAGHQTNVYNNYHYSPPSQISYAPAHGGAPVNYPVYQGQPPTYVYQYKDSGSKYGTLLAGLALMNLGTLGVAGYAAHQANQNHGSTYTPEKGEVCKFAVKKDNGDYEETKIDCQIISGIILQETEAHKSGNQSAITTTTTVTNVTIVNTTNVGGEPATTIAPVPGNVLYSMLPNGTLVPVNATAIHELGVTATHNESASDTANHSASSSVVVTTTTTNTTLVNALDVKGAPVQVTPGMQCFVIRNTPTSNMRKTVPCGLLQTYADKSIRPNSAARNVPLFTLVVVVLAYCVA